MSKSSIIILVILIIVLCLSGYYVYSKYSKTNSKPQDEESSTISQWQEKGVVISGKFADADLVDMGGGKWRLYYSVEPEVAGNKLELYSSVSTDGINWMKEEGVRKEFATFPSVIELSNGKYRLYFQNAGVIKSALSDNGLTWTDEPGVRIEAGEEGLANIENVGAQSVIQLDNGKFLMVYRETIKEKFSNDVPNNNTQIFYYATSSDGLTWEKKGLALDSRNQIFSGLLDGAELIKWDDGKIRLYFWSYKGIYHMTWENGKFNQTTTFDFTNSPGNQAFSPNPPGDPTLGKIGKKWFMYYGQHTKGIYYATSEKE